MFNVLITDFLTNYVMILLVVMAYSTAIVLCIRSELHTSRMHKDLLKDTGAYGVVQNRYREHLETLESEVCYEYFRDSL